jgi:hypothetical protein
MNTNKMGSPKTTLPPTFFRWWQPLSLIFKRAFLKEFGFFRMRFSAVFDIANVMQTEQ